MRILFYLLLLSALVTIRKDFGIKSQAQTSSIGIVVKEDARDLLDSMNAPRDKATGALIFTLRYYNSPEQRLYIWQNGTPTSDSTNSFISKGYIIRPMVVRSAGDTAWCSGYWTAATLYTDASLVRNLAYRVGLAGFVKMADVLTERSRALSAEQALGVRIDNIPAGATGPAGPQGTPATPNSASTPILIAGNNISIQTASGSQPGALSAADWSTFNSKLSTVPAQSWTSITGKPTFFSGAYTDLTGKPVLFDGNYNSLTNLPTLFNGTWASLTGKPTTLAGYGITDGVSSSALAGYQPLITAGTNTQYLRGDKTFQELTTSVVAEGINLYFNNLRARAAISALANGGITYNSATGEVSQTTPTYNNAPGRSLNASFRPSTIRPTRVSYTVSIATTLSLLNLNSSGTVALQISADNTTWVSINSAGITRTLAVSISVGLNDTSLLNVAGEVPAGYYVRLLPVTSGGATITMSSGQEVVY